MAVKIAKWDTAEYLTTPKDIAAYLDAVLEDDDVDLLKVALGNIARSQGVKAIAEKAGMPRQSLYKALAPDGNPEFTTIAHVLRAIGMRLAVVGQDRGRVTVARPTPPRKVAGIPRKAAGIPARKVAAGPIRKAAAKRK